MGDSTISAPRRPVTVLGAGMMGSAVVRALLRAGHPVFVWNRTRAKAEPLAELGATLVDDVTTAIEASGLTICMLLSHDVVIEALAAPISAGTLDGRAFVNLTTCTAQEVSSLAVLVETAGGRFLDATIPGYPDIIGRRGAGLICSGPRDVWDEVSDVVLVLGGRSHLVSEGVVASAVIDTAAIGSFALASQVACIEALAYARSYGITVDQLLPYLHTVAGGFTHLVDELAGRIEREDWTTDRVSMDTVRMSMELFARAIRDAGMPAGPTEAAHASLELGCAEGRGDDDMAALHEVLRRDRRHR